LKPRTGPPETAVASVPGGPATIDLCGDDIDLGSIGKPPRE
jgi:hypothetical protein